MAARVVVKRPDDLPRAVDAAGKRLGCAGHVDLGEIAAGVEEAVVAWGEIGGLCRRVAGERGRTEILRSRRR